MKKNRSSKLFLEALQTVPIVQVACEKAGISRNTVYRWRRDDVDFADEFDRAMIDGIAFVNDMSESQLLQLIKDRHFSAVRYWLNTHHDRYKRDDSAYKKQSEDLQSVAYKKQLAELKENVTRMNNEWFEDCNCSTIDDSDKSIIK